MPDRRTLLKTVGVLGAASLLPAGAAARETVSESFDLDGGPQEALVVFEDRRHVDLLEEIDAPYHAFEVLPIAFARLTGAQVQAVGAHRTVRRVAPNRELEYHNDGAREATGVSAVREQFGYTGEGVHAAVVDTGVDGSHPDLVDSLQHNYRYVDPIQRDTMWVEAGGANTDDNGHGTHCSGSVAGDGTESDGQYEGMAPDVDLTVYSTGLTLAVVQAVGAFDHLLANHAEEVQLVSNSYGTASGDDFDPHEPLNVATWEAFQADVLPLFSAGNSGESCLTPAGQINCETAYNSLNNYVKAPYVLGVAATDDEQVVTDFSSRGRRPGDGGPEGAHYDRDAALENYRTWLEADDSPSATDSYDTVEASGATGGVVAVGGVQTTDTFALPAEDLGDYDNYRVDATLTWEPSNPEGTEPSDFELALETAGGNEVASTSNDGLGAGEENRTTLVVEDLQPGEYQFAVTAWRGAGQWQLEAALERASYDDATVGPLGLYRPGVGAPGSSVVSTMSPGHALQATGPDTEPYYGPLSGTSMSCPVTAGLAALVYEAHADANGAFPDPEQVIGYIEDSAARTLDSHTVVNVGEGFVDAVGAVELARGGSGSAEPVLEPIPDQEAQAGETVSFEAVASPADVSLSASSLPDDATFTDHGDGTGQFVWETDAGDNADSPYTVTITASNAVGSDTEDVEIRLAAPRGNPTRRGAAEQSG